VRHFPLGAHLERVQIIHRRRTSKRRRFKEKQIITTWETENEVIRN
jgi:hypothetical protein